MEPIQLQPLRMSGSYLPDLEDIRQDLLSDSMKRLEFLSDLKDNTRFPFTQDQVRVLKKSRQAGTNAQICLDWGFIPFGLIACSSSIGSCIPLFGVSQGAQAVMGYSLACAGNFLSAQLGLMWGGRNTNTSSDNNNDRQNTLSELTTQYYVLSYDAISLYKDPETKEKIIALAQSISLDKIRSSAAAATLTEDEATRIFKIFEGAINRICGRPWRNIEIEKLMK